MAAEDRHDPAMHAAALDEHCGQLLGFAFGGRGGPSEEAQ
jgi:hypothetical protein